MENEKWLIEGGLLIYLISKCAFLAVIFSAACIFRCYSITWENSHLSSSPLRFKFISQNVLTAGPGSDKKLLSLFCAENLSAVLGRN